MLLQLTPLIISTLEVFGWNWGLIGYKEHIK
jgi:hypothetical protein